MLPIFFLGYWSLKKHLRFLLADFKLKACLVKWRNERLRNFEIQICPQNKKKTLSSGKSNCQVSFLLLEQNSTSVEPFPQASLATCASRAGWLTAPRVEPIQAWRESTCVCCSPTSATAVLFNVERVCRRCSPWPPCCCAGMHQRGCVAALL